MIIDNYDDFVKYIENSPDPFHKINGTRLVPEDYKDRNIWAELYTDKHIKIYANYGLTKGTVHNYFKKSYLLRSKRKSLEILKKELKLLEGE